MTKPLIQTQSRPQALETRMNSDRSCDIWLYGIITDERINESDITALDVVATLNQMDGVDTLNVHINSNGGDVFEGLSIYNTLRDCGKTVNIIGEGIVASMASIIALAGKHFAMAENSLYMIHNPLAFLLGQFNKHDMEKMADELDKVRDSVISAYTNKTGMSNAEIISLLDGPNGKGTYLNPQEALALGFCDSIIPAKTKMVAMLQPSTFMCRGHTLQLNLDKYTPKTSALAKGAMNGGMEVANAKPRAARRGKFKAELIGTVCPHCGGINQLDPSTGIVSPDPAEGATVAVPMDETVEMREGKRFRNEVWRITCVHCGGEYEYDSDPSGAVTTGVDEPVFDPDAPLIQAKRTPKAKRSAPVKAARKRGVRMEGEDIIPDDTGALSAVNVICTECGTSFTVDVDPAIEEAVVVCPNCQAELTVDTSNTGGDGEGIPDEQIIVAFRKGMSNERRRITLLNERKKAFPQFANAIDGFIQNGSSIDCANNWIFQALAANPAQPSGHPAYRAAARRDAQVLNKLGTPAKGDDRASMIAASFDSLAERRGIKKNA